jgi:hypothetical protein
MEDTGDTNSWFFVDNPPFSVWDKQNAFVKEPKFGIQFEFFTFGLN